MCVETYNEPYVDGYVVEREFVFNFSNGGTLATNSNYAAFQIKAFRFIFSETLHVPVRVP